MTDLREREARQQAADGATSAAIDSAIPSSPSRSFERYFALFGYAIVCLVLVAALLEFVSRAIWSVHMGQDERANPEYASPVYEGMDWAKEFFQEEALRRQERKVYVPFRLWGVTNWHGKYINNDAGPRGVWRRTLNPSNCDPRRPFSVWAFGGSTIYGYAVPDWATIPSYLSRELNAGSQNCIVVSNFGVEGYVTDQELILLEEQLKAGGHPDIVVFYDGINDSAMTWNPLGPPLAHFFLGTIKSRVEGSVSGRLDFLQESYAVRLTKRILAHTRSRQTPLIPDSQPNVALVLENYEANMRIAGALSNAYQFKLYCFWQPILVYGHKPLVPFEQRLVEEVRSDEALLVMRSVYQEAEHRAAIDGNFIFLGNLFDSTKHPIYADEEHLGPEGNEVVAKAIASYIRNNITQSK